MRLSRPRQSGLAGMSGWASAVLKVGGVRSPRVPPESDRSPPASPDLPLSLPRVLSASFSLPSSTCHAGASPTQCQPQPCLAGQQLPQPRAQHLSRLNRSYTPRAYSWDKTLLIRSQASAVPGRPAMQPGVQWASAAPGMSLGGLMAANRAVWLEPSLRGRSGEGPWGRRICVPLTMEGVTVPGKGWHWLA